MQQGRALWSPKYTMRVEDEKPILVPIFEIANNVEFDIKTLDVVRYWHHKKKKMVMVCPRGCLDVQEEQRR